MNDEHRDLWQRLEAFELDDPASALSFSVRLARENGWSLRRAQRVIAEYKRFLFLAATAPAAAPVCPSEDVDEAWHLHLCYTRSYWDGLCRGVLGRPLHHEPTRGGAEQLDHHRQMYAHTLAAYRQAFGAEPPGDIWPDVDRRFAHRGHANVDASTHWIVPKPPVRPIVRALNRKLAGAVGVGAIALVPLAGIANPFNLPGPEFLQLYTVLLAASIAGCWFLRRSLRAWDEATPIPELDPYETAVLVGGEDRAVRVALGELVLGGHVTVAKEGKESLSAAKSDYAGQHPLVRDVHRAILARDDATLEDAYNGGRPAAAAIGAKLEGLGLLETAESYAAARWIPSLIMAGVLVFGGVKVAVGMERDKPVIWLVLLCLVAFAALIGFVYRPSRTPRGDRLLRRLKSKYEPLRASKQLITMPSEQLALGLGLFGLAALSAAPGDAAELYKRMTPPDGGAGTGCSGGSGCGGGGCGGGCGGCGGGD